MDEKMITKQLINKPLSSLFSRCIIDPNRAMGLEEWLVDIQSVPFAHFNVQSFWPSNEYCMPLPATYNGREGQFIHGFRPNLNKALHLLAIASFL